MDKNFQKLLSRRMERKPSDDLEDRIMYQINETAKTEKSTYHYLSLAWVFLCVGLVSVIIISFTGMRSNALFYSFDSLDFKSLIQIIGITVTLLLFENLYRKHLELKNNS